MIIYQSGEENISTNVLFKDETFWMTQKENHTQAKRVIEQIKNEKPCKHACLQGFLISCFTQL